MFRETLEEVALDLEQEARLIGRLSDVPAVGRGRPMPERNMKQAQLIPSARALANPRGTAPGWWVERDDRVIAVFGDLQTYAYGVDAADGELVGAGVPRYCYVCVPLLPGQSGGNHCGCEGTVWAVAPATKSP